MNRKDIELCIYNTLHPDVNLRKPSEDEILRLQKQDFQGFILILAEIFSDNNAKIQLRMISGMILKNLLHAKDLSLQKSCESRWYSCEEAYKLRFKDFLILTIKSGPPKLANISGCILGQIGRIEIPRGEDNNFFKRMSMYMHEPNMEVSILEATGTCCNYLIEETQISLDLFAEDIFSISLEKINSGNKELSVASLKCLMNSLEALESVVMVENNSLMFLNKITNLCLIDDDICTKALICLNRFVALYYPVLKKHLVFICNFVLPQFKSDSSSVVIQVFEFCYILAEIGCTKTLEDYLPIILKFTLEKLYKPEKYIEEKWTPHKAASTTLELLSETFNTKIITSEIVSKFIEANMNSSDSKSREIGIIALGSVITSGCDVYLQEVVPILIYAINDPITRDSALWTLAKICESNFLVVINYLPLLLAETGKVVLENSEFSVNAAWVQSCIFASYLTFPDKISKEFPSQTEHPSEIIDKLKRIIEMQYANILNELVKASENVQYQNFDLRNAVFSALTELVKICPESQKGILDGFMSYLLNRSNECLGVISKANADQILIIEDILSNYVILLQVIVSSLDSPKIEEVLDMYCKILDSKPTRAYGDVYISFSHITAKTLPYINAVIPYLCRDLSCNDHFILKAAVNLTGDIANALEASFIPFSSTIMPMLIQNISSTSVPRDLKPTILSVFGDCALALGKAFQPYIEMTLTMLAQIVSLDRSTDEDYVDDLRKNALLMFSCVLIALGDNQHLRVHMEKIVSLIKQLVDNHGAYRCPKEVIDIIGDLITVYGLSFGLDGDWVREFLYESMRSKDNSIKMNADRVCDLLNG